MDPNHGEEQVSLLVEYDHDTSTSSSPPTLPTYLTEKISQPHIGDIDMLSIQALWPRSLHILPSGIGTKQLRATATVLLPSFLQRSYDYKTKLHSTSWLDGLRGIASFIVYIHHFVLIWFPSLSFGYASGPEFHWFIQLPFLRLIYSGRGMVSLFFVISGYALSYSTLRKIRAGNFVAVLDTLASSTFRRWLRLFLPILASTFISVVLIRLDWYIGGAPQRMETFWQQFQSWWEEFVRISDPTQPMNGEYTYSDPYGPQLWTIPREMRGSIVTYIVLMCLAKTRQVVRVACLVFFCWYVLWVQQWDLYLFLGGTLLAELDLLRADCFKDADSTALLQFLPTCISRHATAIMHTLTTVLALISIHLLTWPDQDPEFTPGYRTLLAHTPITYATQTLTQRYWLALGATLLVFTMSLSPSLYSKNATINANTKVLTSFLQSPFNSRIAQYLGKISFGLYIMHLFVLVTVGSRILVWTTGRNMYMYMLAFAVACVVNTGLTVWLSDLFWRLVDVRSVNFAKEVERLCFVK